MRLKVLYGIGAALLLPAFCTAVGNSAVRQLPPEKCVVLLKDSKTDPVWRRIAFRQLLEQEKNPEKLQEIADWYCRSWEDFSLDEL